MAPKEPFKIHSLNKHVEDTKKGLSASAQYNRRPVSKPAAAVVKNEPGVALFGNNNDSDESSESSDSDSDSDEENGADFLKKLGANGAKPSTALQRRSRDEEIADSDVERNASANRNAAVKKEQIVKKAPSSSESSSDSSSESEPEQSEPKAKTNGAGAKQTTAAQESSSSSSEEESEEEDESSEEEEEALEPTPKPTPKPISKSPAAPAPTNGITKKPATAPAKASDSSSSSEEESSEEESSEDEQEEPAKPKVSKKAAEESSSESEEESDAQVDESMHIADRGMDTQVGTPNFIAPDFALRKGDDGANGQDVARICNEANLQGKQFWYFTVPSNVPISVIENIEIPMDRSQVGNRIFSHDGQDYGVSFDTIATKSSIQILIPSASDSKYQPARKQVDQTMHIKRIANLGGAAASSTGPAPRRAPRPQPKGLRARYQPFGVNTPMGNIGADAPENEDVDMAEAPTTVATPKSTKKEKKSKKEDAKKKMDTDVATPSNTADRKGKRKHTTSEDDAVTAEDQLREETRSAETKSKKQKTTRVSSPDLGAELPSAAKKETPIVPPTVPSSAFSSSATAVATPSKIAAATPSTTKKSTKKTKPETPVPTPRQTAVPLPSIPLTSRPKESPVPLPSSSALFATPVQSKSKKGKKSKDEVNATGSSQQSPPPSAQGGDKKKSTIKAKGSS
ncbi:DNA-directed RNA polymerase I subunit [Trichoderma chlorosporum]